MHHSPQVFAKKLQSSIDICKLINFYYHLHLNLQLILLEIARFASKISHKRENNYSSVKLVENLYLLIFPEKKLNLILVMVHSGPVFV